MSVYIVILPNMTQFTAWGGSGKSIIKGDKWPGLTKLSLIACQNFTNFYMLKVK